MRFVIPGAGYPCEGHLMSRAALLLIGLSLSCVAATPDEGALVNSMDDVRVQAPKEKGHFESVEGKVGKAVKFSFDNGCKSQFCMTNIRATPEWDKVEGFS